MEQLGLQKGQGKSNGDMEGKPYSMYHPREH